MTIKDKDAALLYRAMEDETRPKPVKIHGAANVADKTFEALAAYGYAEGLKVPSDDRAENITHAIFRLLVEANGYSVETLAAIVRATDWEDA